MIDVKGNKHDDLSIEFKLGFHNDGNREGRENYAVNTWIFVPGSLDIDPETYGKKQFYRDIKSNVRLITPIFELGDIAKDNSEPIAELGMALKGLESSPSQEALNNYEHHIKLFAAIYKSALRNYSASVLKEDNPTLGVQACHNLLSYVRYILKTYRDMHVSAGVVDERAKNFFMLGDEFMSRQTDYRCMKIIRDKKYAQNEEVRAIFTQMLEEEQQYKNRVGYDDFYMGDAKANTKLIYKYSMLKKFIESDLYIRLKRKSDAFAVEQIYYSLAAGLAMIFATGVAWFFQIRYGNITWPLFIALVISYMLKDRIKDLMRHYFAHKRLNRYFDNKAHIRIGEQLVGEFKEGFDFINLSQIPQEVRNMRQAEVVPAEVAALKDENILLFRKYMSIDHKKLSKVAAYSIAGINEILRIHLNRFTLKMDNPEAAVDMYDSALGVTTIPTQRIYKIHIIMQLIDHGATKYKNFRITMTRNGIVRVREIAA